MIFRTKIDWKNGVILIYCKRKIIHSIKIYFNSWQEMLQNESHDETFNIIK